MLCHLNTFFRCCPSLSKNSSLKPVNTRVHISNTSSCCRIAFLCEKSGSIVRAPMPSSTKAAPHSSFSYLAFWIPRKCSFDQKKPITSKVENYSPSV